MDTQQLWQGVLGELELSLSKPNFTTWFRNTAITSFNDGCITVSVPNAFTQTWFQKKYHDNILKTLKRMTNNDIREIVYRIEPIAKRIAVDGIGVGVAPVSEQPAAFDTQTAKPEEERLLEELGFNIKYLFSNFVVGKNNELAHAAARAVAQKPGRVYNPLFIYGGVGLGKTHLLQGIGQHILLQDSTKKIRYVTCEQFTNEYIRMVRSGHASEFKDRYRNIDVLLVDDIQFITGKEGTQEEFFHTFNTLHQMNKQIVLTSDRPPKAILSLEHRLLSRFEWGMIADVSAPDLETRLAILQAKAEELKAQLDKDILNYIATTIQDNIRELEGALNRIVAFHQLNGSEPSVESAKNILSSIATKASRRALTPKQILNTVSTFYDVEIALLLGASRKKELVVPRQIVMYLLREEAGCSYPSIGNELGGRDHTTAMHAYDKIGKQLETNERMRQEVHLIRQRLYVE